MQFLDLSLRKPCFKKELLLVWYILGFIHIQLHLFLSIHGHFRHFLEFKFTSPYMLLSICHSSEKTIFPICHFLLHFLMSMNSELLHQSAPLCMVFKKLKCSLVRNWRKISYLNWLIILFVFSVILDVLLWLQWLYKNTSI